MEQVRSAAAMAGYVDVEKLLFDAAREFHAAETPLKLDDAWRGLVAPIYDQLSEQTLSILHSLYSLNMTVKLNSGVSEKLARMGGPPNVPA